MSYSNLFVKGRIKRGDWIKGVLLPYLLIAFFLAALFYFLPPISQQIPALTEFHNFLLGMGSMYYILYLLPVILVAYAFAYPKAVVDSKRKEIDTQMHYYITHWGVFSRAEIKIEELLNEFVKRKEYKALRDETEYLYNLQTKFKLNFGEACRFARKRSPSKLLSDFLGRFGHAVESGQDARDFLSSEQDAVLNEYSNSYDRRLYSIDVFKEIYISLMIAVMFLAVFGIIAPFISGIDPLLTLSGVFLVFVTIQLLLVYFLKAVSPEDPLWQTSELTPKNARKRNRYFIASIAAAAGIGITIFLLIHLGYISRDLPYLYQLVIAAVVAPLLFVGIKTKNIENLIKRKEDLTPTFIRSVGAAAGSTGGKITDAVKYLASHDFDPLTDEIVQFHRRLSIGINEERAWTLFTTGTGSNLIYRFCDIFRGGLELGCNPTEIGSLISENMERSLNLRKKRYASADTLIGIIYGLMIAVGFALFVTFGIAGYLNDTWSQTQAETVILPERIDLMKEIDAAAYNQSILTLSENLKSFPTKKLVFIVGDNLKGDYQNVMYGLLNNLSNEEIAGYLGPLVSSLKSLPPGDVIRAVGVANPEEITTAFLLSLQRERLVSLIGTYSPSILADVIRGEGSYAREQLEEIVSPQNLAKLESEKLADLFAYLNFENRVMLIERLDEVEGRRLSELQREADMLRGEARKSPTALRELEKIIVEMESIQKTRSQIEQAVGGIIFPIYPAQMNLVELVLLALIMISALASSLAIAIASGGHVFGSLSHFVFLTWLGFVAGIIADMLVSSLLYLY